MGAILCVEWVEPDRCAARGRTLIRQLAASRSISEKDSDPTRQSHPASPPGGRRQKSTVAQPLNLIEIGAVKASAGCDIAQSSQIAHTQIPLHPGSREFNHNGQSDKERDKKQREKQQAKSMSSTCMRFAICY